MRKILLLGILLLTAGAMSAQETDTDHLFQQLDEAIARSEQYVAQREERIAKLKRSLEQAGDAQSRYDVNFHIFEEYKAYKNDSAMVYIDRCIALAQEIGDRTSAADGLALLAKQCSAVGMYSEALNALESIDRRDLDRKGLGDYYVALNHVYGELGYYSKVPRLSQEYYKKADQYRDSLYSVLDPGSEMSLLKRESQLLSEGKTAEALKVNDRRLAMAKEGTHEYGIVAYYRHLIYREMKDEAQARYWLAQSALCDVQNGVMDQASLWILASNLSNGGDVERSYRYITFAWNAANTFGTRVRNWQIAPILGNIDHSYQQQIKRTNRELLISIGVVSLLALAMLALVYYMSKQRSRLAVARDELKNVNGQLEGLNSRLSGMNDELDAANRQLSLTNQELSVANGKLNESNRVKEEYIGRFLGLCSLYIDKMDKFRQQVNRLMKNKQMDELFRLTRNTELKDTELDELYANFDAVFLHLFPTFVDDLNSLLKDDYRIELSDPKKLTTPVRVFALIRLGVEDSSKIAEFLHYSVNTIYNYRAKYRNGAIGDRNDFERKVKELASGIGESA